MLGCDIIDLEYTRLNSKWQRKGFLTKIFTKNEQALIHQSSDPFNLVWRLWSMKESTYKAHSHLSQTRAFNPSKLVCQPIDKTRGSVEIDNQIYLTISESTEQYIFTTASRNAALGFKSKTIELDSSDASSQSEACYNALRQQISLDRKLDKSMVEIQKNELGVPYVFINNQLQNIKLSLSHHGWFGGFVMMYIREY